MQTLLKSKARADVPYLAATSSFLHALDDHVRQLGRVSASNGAKNWLQEKIAVADEVLVAKAVEKINDGDVVATYASSSVVQAVLVSAHQVRALLTCAPSSAGDSATAVLSAQQCSCTRAVQADDRPLNIAVQPKARIASTFINIDSTTRQYLLCLSY